VKVESPYDPLSNVGRSASARQGGDLSFSQILAQAGLSGQGEPAAGGAADAAGSKTRTAEEKAAEQAAAKAAQTKAANDALRKELDDYLNKSPAEHMRDAILAKMGLSEEKLNAMPPEERAAVEAEIARRITEWMLSKEEEAPAAGALPAGLLGQQSLSAEALANSPAGMPEFAALQAALSGGR